MGERDLVVADDGVVKIGDPKGAVGAEFYLDGAERGIVTREKVGLAGGEGRGAAPVEAVAVDAAGDGIAVEEIVLEFGREGFGGVVGDAGDGGGAVVVGGHGRGEAEAIVFFADAFVVAAGDEEVDGLRVGIGGVEFAAGIEGETVGIGLAVGDELEAGAVGAEAVGIAAGEFHGAAGAVGDLGGIGEAVRAVDPAVEPEPVAGGHAVGVAEAEAIIEFLAEIGAAVAIGVGEAPDCGDGIDEERVAFRAGSSGEREEADGDVQAVGESGDLAGAAGDGIEIGEDADGIGTVLDGLGRGGGGAEGDAVLGPVFVEGGDRLAERVAAGGPRIERGAGDPDAAKGIEGEVEGFLDFGFVGDELDFETGREFEKGFRLGGRQQRGGQGVAAGIGGAGGRRGGGDEEEGETERERKGAAAKRKEGESVHGGAG